MKVEELKRSSDAMNAQQQALFNIELKKCYDHIERVHSHDNKGYTFYPVPLALPAEPVYDWEKCVMFMRASLKTDGYYVRIYKDARTLFISWDPAMVKKDPHLNEQRQDEPLPRVQQAAPQEARPKKELVIDFNPASPLSQLNLRATLMANNPKYGHLKSIHRRT